MPGPRGGLRRGVGDEGASSDRTGRNRAGDPTGSATTAQPAARPAAQPASSTSSVALREEMDFGQVWLAPGFDFKGLGDFIVKTKAP